jgi:transcriptional regulator with XRE-family HTH domain
MSKETIYEEFIKDNEFERLMAQEDFILDVTESFCDILEKDNIKRSKLAELLGKTKGYISQILGGGRNITLKTMADIAFVLGYEIDVRFVKKSKKVKKDSYSFSWEVGKKSTLDISDCSAPDDYYPACQKLTRIAV